MPGDLEPAGVQLATQLRGILHQLRDLFRAAVGGELSRGGRELLRLGLEVGDRHAEVSSGAFASHRSSHHTPCSSTSRAPRVSARTPVGLYFFSPDLQRHIVVRDSAARADFYAASCAAAPLGPGLVARGGGPSTVARPRPARAGRASGRVELMEGTRGPHDNSARVSFRRALVDDDRCLLPPPVQTRRQSGWRRTDRSPPALGIPTPESGLAKLSSWPSGSVRWKKRSPTGRPKGRCRAPGPRRRHGRKGHPRS